MKIILLLPIIVVLVQIVVAVIIFCIARKMLKKADIRLVPNDNLEY